MIITIPSYRRPLAIQRKTLKLLERLGVDRRRVTIFVADRDELQDYTLALPYKWASRLQVSCPGLRDSRNFIYDWAPKDEEILMMDDDVSNIYVRHPGITMATPRKDQCHEIRPDEFELLCDRGFYLCKLHGATLWGVYPTNNPLHMRDREWVGMSYIVGAFFGVVNTQDRAVYGQHPIKEDYERTLRHFVRDGKVVRLDGYGVSTAYFGGTGGLHADGMDARTARANVAIDALLAEFPHLCQEHQRKTYRDIKLKRSNYLSC